MLKTSDPSASSDAADKQSARPIQAGEPEQAPAQQTEPGVWRGVARGVMAALAVLIIAVAAFSFVVPRFIDAVPLAVLSGSMEPTYAPGDLVVTRALPPEEIRVGDVVTFQPESGDPMLITHRVIAKSLGTEGLASFTTQGDANGSPDEPILPEQVKGKVIYSVPYLGYLTTALGPAAKSALAAVIGVGLVGYALWTVVSGARGRKHSAPARESLAAQEEASAQGRK